MSEISIYIYWAGSMDDGEKLETGKLYRLDGDLSLYEMDESYTIPMVPPSVRTVGS